MSAGTVIIITTPPKLQNLAEGDDQETVIKVKLEGEGSVSDLLREAADVIDGRS